MRRAFLNLRSTTLGRGGFTLVELMVATGLFSIMMLAATTLMAEHAKRTGRASNEVRISEELGEFTEVVESYLANATHIQACNGCGGGTCIYNSAANEIVGAFAGAQTLFTFEAETANDPGNPAAAPCLYAAARPTSVVPEALVPRGCKRDYRVTFTQPTPVTLGSPNILGTPGVLALVDVASGQTLHRLNGVVALKCGQPVGVAATGAPATDQFVLDIRVKARLTHLARASSAAQLQGWHPTDPDFAVGIFRNLATQVTLRNINVPGVHFGRSRSFQQCIPNGGNSTTGPCCSGYAAGGFCLASNACTVRGTAAAADETCCSNQRDTGGVCL